MLNRALPYFLEDRTGHLAHTHLEDIYDRLFLTIAPSSPAQPLVLAISNTGRRTTTRHDRRTRHHSPSEPSVLLQFGPKNTLGTVLFPSSNESLPMAHWLKKTSLFSSSLSRKFRASNGQDYRWIHRATEGQEWTLVDACDCLVAHYNLKSPDKPAYTTSGNVLTIDETHGHLAVEIFASLTIMRHIAEHHL